MHAIYRNINKMSTYLYTLIQTRTQYIGEYVLTTKSGNCQVFSCSREWVLFSALPHKLYI